MRILEKQAFIVRSERAKAIAHKRIWSLREQVESNGSPAASVGEPDFSFLTVVLEYIPRAAFICGGDGQVLSANAAGEHLLAADPESWRELIYRALRECQDSQAISVFELAVPGHGPHFLVVARRGGSRVKRVVQTARAAWALTERETQVLDCVAAGNSNRSIASQLRLAARTVELHVTSLLRKAAVESRSQLIVALWELSDGLESGPTSRN